MVGETGLRLLRRVAVGRPPVLDESQWAVSDACLEGGPHVLLGAPGTGVTTTLVESVVARVEHGTPAGGVLMFASDRRAAASLRDRVTARLGQTVVEPAARTAAAYAFSLIRADANVHGEPEPRLISGPEQDAILADILAGHAHGEGRDPGWPSFLRDVLGLTGFRHELRDLLMRAMERGLLPQDLAELGERVGRPAWVAASSLMQEYLEVTALAAAGAYDPAAIVDAAVALLDSDPELLAREQRRWCLVVVDDLQEAGEAVARLLERLRPPGSDVLLAGDPDVTTQSFRGASPELLAQAPRRFPDHAGDPARVHVLGQRWRTPVELMGVVQAVTSSIGVVGSAAHRRAKASRTGGGLRVGVVGSPAQEAAWVARVLRDEHLAGGVEWSDMAVIVRSSGLAATLRRSLAAAQVPTAAAEAAIPLKDEPAVRPLRLAMRAVLQPSSLTGEVALELLAGPLGAADPLDIRRIRRWAISRAVPAEDVAPSADVLARILRERDLEILQEAPEAVRRSLEPLAGVLTAGAGAAAARGADAEGVLWALWHASGLAVRWRAQALAGGDTRRGEQADRDLDAVMALFETAERFGERNPGAAPVAFLDVIEAQEVPEDTLAARAPRGSSVSVLTPQSAAGKEWDVVVLAGLTEGVWPDTRLRGSLLGSGALVDVVGGREEPSVRTARAQVLADERRMFNVAVTRTRRLLAAVAISTEEEQPSDFFGVLHEAAAGVVERPVEFERTPLPRPATLAGVVAELRRSLVVAEPGSTEAVDAAHELARLAAAGVPGADPSQWYGLAQPSDDAPLWDPGAPVPVSPSALETYISCPLRWLLQRHGGQAETTTRQAVGVMVHDIAHAYPRGSLAQLEAERVERFDALDLPQTWIGTREDERSSEMVRKLAGYFTGTARELVATELDFSVRIGRAVLRGRVDRLERDEQGRLVVVDLKTGSQQPSKDALGSHPQLGAYQAAVEAGAFEELTGSRVSGGAALVQLGGRQRSAPEQGQPPLSASPDPQWAAAMIRDAAEGMAGTTFPAIRNDGCRHCSVRTSCPLQPEGRQL